MNNVPNCVIAWLRPRTPSEQRDSIGLASHAAVQSYRDGSCKFVFVHVWSVVNIGELQAHLRAHGYPRTQVGIRGDSEFRGHFILEVTVLPGWSWLHTLLYWLFVPTIGGAIGFGSLQLVQVLSPMSVLHNGPLASLFAFIGTSLVAMLYLYANPRISKV
jgi:hypothetical protein